MFRLLAVDEAAGLIEDGDVIVINGMGMCCNPYAIYPAIESRFLTTEKPRDLTVMVSAGLGERGKHSLLNHLAHPGLVRRVIAGFWDGLWEFHPLVAANEIEGYNLPQGIIPRLLRAAAAGNPGYISRVGLYTFLDPRQGGGRLNEVTTEPLVDLIEWEGKEYLYYRTVRPTVALLRGTTVDPRGNITMEKEVAILDPLATAMAVKNNGGKVIVQVEKLSEKPANPKDVKIPGFMVDAVYVEPNQRQTLAAAYDPLYSGERRLPEEAILEQYSMALQALEQPKTSFGRGVADLIIARRAALELKPGDVVNLGIGIPTLVGVEAFRMGVGRHVIFTIESGTSGGFPALVVDFGVNLNPDAVYEQAAQFDFYDGGGLDMSFVGALQVDRHGNVNSHRIGNRIFGIGGFVHVTQSPRKVMVLTKFGLGVEADVQDHKLVLMSDCQSVKFVPEVQEVSLSARYALESGQEILYVTERAVFRLAPGGIELVEVAPGIDVRRDVLDFLPFEPAISPALTTMDRICFSRGC